jgi:hypothetical protein
MGKPHLKLNLKKGGKKKMPIYTTLAAAYARAIYLDGTKKFSDIKPEYIDPVKQYAGANYTQEQIDGAFYNKFITSKEYADTLSYKA